MTRMTPLLERNEQIARTYTTAALGIPARQVLIVTCLDHRVDPAIILGLQLGDAPVIRNADGRVTQAVIDDIAYLGMRSGRQGIDAVPHAPAGTHRAFRSHTERKRRLVRWPRTRADHRV